MTPSSAKAKGRRLQQDVASRILATFPELEPDDCRSCSMGSGGEDVQLSPAARRVMPFSIECKKRASFAVYKDYAQATGHGPHEPLLVIQGDRKKALAVIDLDTLLALIVKAG